MGKYSTSTSYSLIMMGTTFDTATTLLCAECITWADNEIEKHLSKRYDVSAFTATSAPPMLNTISKWLTQGYMYQQMSRGGEDAMTRG